MNDKLQEGTTPVERLLISREHIRRALRDAPPATNSLLHSLLQSASSRHPLGLAGVAAVIGGLVMAFKPWRWKTLTTPLLMWGVAALTEWLRRNDPERRR